MKLILDADEERASGIVQGYRWGGQPQANRESARNSVGDDEASHRDGEHERVSRPCTLPHIPSVGKIVIQWEKV